MRISNQMLQQSALAGLRARLEALAQAQAASTTGRRIRTLSDDPLGASEVMRLASTLRDVEQYRRNGTFANTRLSAEEVTLNSVVEALQDAKGLAIASASPDPADPTRQAALAEVRNLIQHVISLGNTKVGNEYIFGGGETLDPPFKSDGSYVGDTTIRRAEIGEGLLIDTNHTGDQILAVAVQALQALETELASGTPASIQGSLAGLESAVQGSLVGNAEVGVRLRQIKDAGDGLGGTAGRLLDRIQQLRDSDPTESAVKLISAQQALEQAYAAVSRTLNLNLLDQLQ